MHRCVGAGVVYSVDVGVARGVGVGVDLDIGDASWHRCCIVASVLELRRGIGVGVVTKQCWICVLVLPKASVSGLVCGVGVELVVMVCVLVCGVGVELVVVVLVLLCGVSIGVASWRQC